MQIYLYSKAIYILRTFINLLGVQFLTRSDVKSKIAPLTEPIVPGGQVKTHSSLTGL